MSPPTENGDPGLLQVSLSGAGEAASFGAAASALSVRASLTFELKTGNPGSIFIPAQEGGVPMGGGALPADPASLTLLSKTATASSLFTFAQQGGTWSGLGMGPADAVPVFWREPEKSFVFIGSPGDVATIRQKAHRAIDGYVSRLGLRPRIDVFEFERYIKEKGWDTRVSFQFNLPRPSHQKCRAAIAILGARIGTPLERSFPAERLIANYNELADPARRYRLLHPWPAEPEDQLRAVNNRCYPLTGTVFEYLDARAAKRPVLMCYIANKEIRPGKGRVLLNDDVWEKSISFSSEEEKDLWRNLTYKIETGAVHNFVNAMNEDSQPLVRQCSDELHCLERIQAFIADYSILGDVTRRANPYKSLDYFDIAESGDFFGYGERLEEMVARFRERMDSRTRPLAMKILGKSGCGKSSFLRAGILGRLSDSRELERFRVVAVRPTELQNSRGKPEAVLSKLLKIVESEVGDLSLPDADGAAVEAAGPNAPETLATILKSRLAAIDVATPVRLLIGLDQFEEIVDDLAAGVHSSEWLPLIRFIEIAATGAGIGFVYTLETSREATLAGLKLSPVFDRSLTFRMDGESDSFLADIIRKPFANNGFDLDERVVDELIAAYRKAVPPNAGWSNLPLLSLKLYQLFEKIAEQFQTLRLEDAEKDGDFFQRRKNTRARDIHYADVEGELQFTNLLAELAEEAWIRKDADDEKEIETLDLFLQPLIRLGGEHSTEIHLQSVGRMRYHVVQARIERFRARRLVARDPDGRYRLVHESIIRLWPLADKWYKAKLRYLEKEVELRKAARAWDLAERAEALLLSGETAIQHAADVLSSHMHTWSFGIDEDLLPEDRVLKAFCVEIFSGSRTPTKSNPEALQYKGPHVALAASFGLVDLLKRFIEIDPECVNFRSARGKTPVSQAAWAHPKAIRLLLDARADPTIPDEDHWRPISAPIYEGNSEIFRALFPYYLDSSTHDCPNGRNLLHICAHNNAVEMAIALMEGASADPLKKDSIGWDPLFTSAYAGAADAFEVFRKRCPLTGTDNDKNTLLHVAASAGRGAIIERLLKLPEFSQSIDARNKYGFDALMWAAFHREPGAVDLLRKNIRTDHVISGTDGYEGWTALHCAIGRPKPERRLGITERLAALQTVRVLLESPETDPGHVAHDTLTPFQRASHLPDVRQLLLESGRIDIAATLANGTTLLIVASRDGNARLVTRLLEDGTVDVDYVSPDGSYAPALMLSHNLLPILEGLIRSGRCKPWRAMRFEKGLLSSAIQHDAKPIVGLLMERLHDERPKGIGKWLTSALQSILEAGRYRELFEPLLSAGAFVDTPVDITNGTLLHQAARHGDLDAFKALLAHSPRRMLDGWGRTPADCAPDGSAHVFGRLLERYRPTMKEPELPALQKRESYADNAPPKRPLHQAARHGHLGKLDVLVRDLELDPLAPDDWGRLPSDVAPESTRREIQDMMEQAARQRPPRRSAVHSAAKAGLVSRMAKLAAGEDTRVDEVDDWGRSLADIAPESVRDPIRQLIESYSKPARTLPAAIRTAACVGDMVELEKQLRLLKVDPDVTDEWGRTLADLVPERSRDALAQLTKTLSEGSGD